MPHAFPLALAAALALAQAGCNRSHEPKARPPTPVRVMEVAPPTDAKSATRLSGNVEAGVKVDLAFKVGGYIRELAEIKDDGQKRALQEGDWVKKGAVLAVVRESDYQNRLASANASQAQATAGLKQAKLDYDRVVKLLESKSVAQAEVDGKKANLDNYEAQLQGAKAQIADAALSLSDCTLKSPMEGVIVKRNVEVGTLVSPGIVGFTVADTRTVKILFGTPEAMLNKVSIGSEVTIFIEALNLEVKGKISRIAPSADPKSRVFDVQATIPNPDDKVKVGMIASLKIADEVGAKTSEILALPLTAVVRPPKDSRGFAVYIAEGQPGSEVAHLREVKLGNVLGNSVLVTEGLKAGDRVISSGATLVSDGEKINVVP